MSFANKPQQELEVLLSYGASFEISVANRTPEQLNNLASYARSGGGQVVLTGASALAPQTLVNVASFGKGHVFFKD